MIVNLKYYQTNLYFYSLQSNNFTIQFCSEDGICGLLYAIGCLIALERSEDNLI